MDWDKRFSIEDYLFGIEPAQALVKLEKIRMIWITFWCDYPLVEKIGPK